MVTEGSAVSLRTRKTTEEEKDKDKDKADTEKS